eukprot:352421-Chlamydomonas_euryale.AAC.66
MEKRAHPRTPRTRALIWRPLTGATGAAKPCCDRGRDQLLLGHSRYRTQQGTPLNNSTAPVR